MTVDPFWRRRIYDSTAADLRRLFALDTPEADEECRAIASDHRNCRGSDALRVLALLADRDGV